jgi:hypothetical protein
MVFNLVPYSDADGNALAVLNNRAGNAGWRWATTPDSCRC